MKSVQLQKLSAVTQSQAVASVSALDEISIAPSVSVPTTAQVSQPGVHSPAGAGAAAVTTSQSASVRPKVTNTEDPRIIQTRKQAKEQAEYTNNALVCLLKEAIDNQKIKTIFKLGDKIPDFLVTYVQKIISRANAHPPPDELAECIGMYRVADVYNLNHSELTHESLNILNTLYEFEHSTPSTPSKVSNWIKQKYKQRSKSAID